MTDKSTISLFSGAMGLDIGLEKAGFKTMAIVEKDKKATETIKLNRSDIHIFDRTIQGIDSSEILESTGLKSGEICLLSGGPCCQSFSTVGNRGSLGDPRGSLFRDFTRMVKDLQPRFFIMENVKGILSAAVKHRTLNNRGPGYPPLESDEELGSALKIILAEFAELNYYVLYSLINCADFGVPQNRMRVIFLGSRDGENISMPAATHAKRGGKNLKKWLSLRRAIGGLKESNPEYLDFPKDRLELLAQLTEGQNWTDLPEDLQEKALGAAFISWGGRGGFCRRLDWGKPSPTLTTSPIGRATTLCHPDELRPLTVLEYATLQQFPKSWKFAGSVQQKYMQIGNAVPVGVGKALGQALISTIQETDSVGLPVNAEKRLGMVKCADPDLEKKIQKRRRTQLHPARLLKTDDPEKIKEWLSAKA
jgi:DNA (cytosine-5)-methyltransferase 1